MANGSGRRPLKIIGKAWVIALTTVSAVILAVVAAGGGPLRATHDEMMMTLRAVDANHASLQRDILRSRAGLLRSYDPLVNSVVALREIVTRLEALVSQAGFSHEGRLETLLGELQRAIDSDEELVEHFKTRNALLQNSTDVFGQTLTSLYKSADPKVKMLMIGADDLGNLMMRFSLRPSGELEVAIRECLKKVMGSKVDIPANRDVRTLVTHAEMILAILPVVDEKIAAIQASQIPVRAQQLQSQYLEIYGNATSRAAWSRVVLGVTAISLCLYVFVLVYRLRGQTARLERRLEYEGVVAQAKSAAANSSSGDFPDLMDRILRQFCGFFEADACCFAIVRSDSQDARELYQIGEPGAEFLGTVCEFARQLSFADRAADNLNLVKPGEPAYTRGAMVSGIVNAVKLPDRHIGTLLFLYDVARPKMGADEISVIQGMIRMLAEFIETERARQERDALESRLEHAQRLEAVGTLAGGIAHEFNNVLGAILGYGEMALQMLRKPSTTRRYVEEILSSGEKAKQIVDQILTFSRKRERAVKPFDVVEAVSDIIPLLHVTLGGKVTLTTRLPDQPAVIEGSPTDIHQIVMNLCKNAMEASSRGQEILVDVSSVGLKRRRTLSHSQVLPGDYVCLSVHDQGPGIPETVLPHIFEPFFTTRGLSGGTGLGLSAVHGSVTALGGALDVQSVSGFGTRFEVFFPASDQPPLPVKQFFNERSVPTGLGETVLIFEKDRSLLDMYEEKVAALGYEPVGSESFEEFLSDLNCNSTKPDLVIIDRQSLGASVDLQELANLLMGTPYLLLADRNSGSKPDEHRLIHPGTLGKPFSSKALAYAIYDRINLRSITR
jgi:signal transduction histidine kinase